MVRVDRIKAAWERFGARFTSRVLHPLEIEDCKHAPDPAQSLAVRWAAKEAIFKTVGNRMSPRLDFADICIRRNTLGQAPKVLLFGRAKEQAKRVGIMGFQISLSHDGNSAFAMCLVAMKPSRCKCQRMPSHSVFSSFVGKQFTL